MLGAFFPKTNRSKVIFKKIQILHILSLNLLNQLSQTINLTEKYYLFREYFFSSFFFSKIEKKWSNEAKM